MKTTTINSIIILMMLILLSYQVQAQYDTVYSDELATDWYTTSWGGGVVFDESTTNPHNGTQCYDIEYADWDGFGIEHRHVNYQAYYYFYPNQHKYINFWFNPGDEINQIANVTVTLDVEGSVNIVNYIHSTIIANTWYNVRIPVVDMNPDNNRFCRVFFPNESGSLTPHFYLDDICFEYVDDTSKPVISDVTIEDIEQDIATISWKTDEPVQYTLNYRIEGSTGPYVTISSDKYTTGESNDISDLTPSTDYEIVLTCQDHQRDPATTPNESVHNGTFSTIAADVTDPIISNLQVIDVYSNRVTILWNTNERCDTRLDFGKGIYDTSYYDDILTLTHTVVLTHLDPNTTYQFKYDSQDKQGNLTEVSENPPRTFTTSSEVDTIEKCIVTDHPLYQWDEIGPNDVPWEYITHLNLGQLWPAESDSGYTLDMGNYVWWGTLQEWKTEAVEFITNGHNAKRKVICMLGGADSNPDGQWNEATSEDNVVAFAQNIRETLEPLGFDGVCLDWEDNYNYLIDFPSFISLTREIRQAWPDAYIDVPTGLNGDDAVDFAPANDYVNSFSPMSYYPIPQWGGFLIPAPVTPLHSIGDNGYGIDYTVQQFISAGVPANKVIIGVGGFGAVWGDSNDDGIAPVRTYVNVNDLSGYPNGERESLGSDNLVSWTFVNNLLHDYPKLYESWDDVGKCNYWHTADSSKQITVPIPGANYDIEISLILYETARSMSNKAEFIIDNNLKGVGYWTLSQLMYNGFSPVLDVASCMLLDTSSSKNSDTIPNANPLHEINAQYATNIELYPNPVQDILYVNNLNSNEIFQIKITDILGRIICKQELTEGTNQIRMPQTKGLIIVIIQDKNGRIIERRKVMKL